MAKGVKLGRPVNTKGTVPSKVGPLKAKGSKSPIATRKPV